MFLDFDTRGQAITSVLTSNVKVRTGDRKWVLLGSGQVLVVVVTPAVSPHAVCPDWAQIAMESPAPTTDPAPHTFSQVLFVDIPKSYPPATPITCRYTLTPALQPEPRDWVGIFKVRWGVSLLGLCWLPPETRSCLFASCAFSTGWMEHNQGLSHLCVDRCGRGAVDDETSYF